MGARASSAWPRTLHHSRSLREFGAEAPTDGPQRVGKTPESPVSGMTQQQEKCLSEGRMGLGQPHVIPCAKHETGAIDCSQVRPGPQDGMEAMGASWSPGI